MEAWNYNALDLEEILVWNPPVTLKLIVFCVLLHIGTKTPAILSSNFLIDSSLPSCWN